MKKHIFDKFVDNICSHTKIKKEDLLKKNKFADVVLARQTLFYVCYNRGIKKSIINQYMTDEGYDIGTSAINYGIKTIKDLIDKDLDFMVIVDKLSNLEANSVIEESKFNTGQEQGEGGQVGTFNFTDNTDKPNFCGNCGKEVLSSSNFCSNCGNKINI